MTTTTFEAGRTVARPALLARLPLRALIVGGIAAAAMLAGGIWIALPASSVSTDDAYLKADSTIVAPKIAGLVSRIYVHDNQAVKAGQPLIEIDPEDYRQAVSAAEADLASAEAALAQQSSQQAFAEANARAAEASIRSADAEKTRAAADRTRFDSLEKDGDISHQQADLVRSQSLSANADADKARAAFAASEQQIAVTAQTRGQLAAAVDKAKAALALARQNLDHTVIRASVDGVIGDRQAQLGEYVGPGTQLLTIVPMNTIYVAANFKETQTARMLVGQHARMEFDALPGARFDGVVESFSPGSGSEFSLLPFEPATGNFTRIVQRLPVRIHILPNQTGIEKLRPGLSADVTVDLSH